MTVQILECHEACKREFSLKQTTIDSILAGEKFQMSLLFKFF